MDMVLQHKAHRHIHRQHHSPHATSWQNFTTISGVLCSAWPACGLSLWGQIRCPSTLTLQLSHHLLLEELQIAKILKAHHIMKLSVFSFGIRKTCFFKVQTRPHYRCHFLPQYLGFHVKIYYIYIHIYIHKQIAPNITSSVDQILEHTLAMLFASRQV